jgi:nitrate reductase NapE
MRRRAAVTKDNELKIFLFLTVVLWPLIAVAVVGVYGLFIWIYQMLMGPPTG